MNDSFWIDGYKLNVIEHTEYDGEKTKRVSHLSDFILSIRLDAHYTTQQIKKLIEPHFRKALKRWNKKQKGMNNG